MHYAASEWLDRAWPDRATGSQEPGVPGGPPMAPVFDGKLSVTNEKYTGQPALPPRRAAWSHSDAAWCI